jgi:hypothetical protein
MNILCIGTFSLLSLYKINDYIRPLLISYFLVDGYKKKWDIVLHHSMFSIMAAICPLEYIQKTLVLEWTTLCLLLYKHKYPTKELFAISWVILRLIYCPYLFYTFQHEYYFVNHLSIIIYYLHFLWTCKIINNIDTTKGISSMLLMIVPLHNLHYDVSLHTYICIYMQCQLSFYYRVFQTDFLHSLDTSMIMYISLDYLNMYPYVSILYFIYRQYGTYKFHTHVFLMAVSKLCYYNYELIPYVIVGIYSLKNEHTLIWHICSSVIMYYCKLTKHIEYNIRCVK